MASAETASTCPTKPTGPSTGSASQDSSQSTFETQPPSSQEDEAKPGVWGTMIVIGADIEHGL